MYIMSFCTGHFSSSILVEYLNGAVLAANRSIRADWRRFSTCYLHFQSLGATRPLAELGETRYKATKSNSAGNPWSFS